MGAQLVSSSNAKIRDSLEIFTLDADRWLAALYWCVRQYYGAQAARIVADCWLGILENGLEDRCQLAELGKITKSAIVLSPSRVGKASPAACKSSTPIYYKDWGTGQPVVFRNVGR